MGRPSLLRSRSARRRDQRAGPRVSTSPLCLRASRRNRTRTPAHDQDRPQVGPSNRTFALSGAAAAQGDGRDPRRRRPADVAPARLLLLAVLLRLLGKWAWYLPEPIDRLLPNVRF